MTGIERWTWKIKASQAFRPGAPIDSLTLFTGRLEQISDVIGATVQPGRHVIMYGERGVGKTSLAKVLSEILSQAGMKVLNSGTINCDGTDDFSTLWHKIFRELSHVIKQQGPGFNSATVSEEKSLDDLLPQTVTPDDIRFTLLKVGSPVIIVIDELDQIKDRKVTRLLADLRSILVDRHAFMSPRLEYRLRFSVAHEIGHLILHRDIYGGLQHATAAKWFDYISAIPEVEYGWVEWQAYEFAGRLLVPPDPLREAFKNAIQTAEAAGYTDWTAADEAALDYIATRIAPKFGVSAEVISKRIRVEKLWPPR